MMNTPNKRRSLSDHRHYYSNVAPKVQTRWPNGIPLIRKPNNKKLIRRNTESCISLQVSALISPENIHQYSRIEEENNQSHDDDAYTPASTSLDESNELNISTSLDISTHLDIVSGHFKNLFSQLENFLDTKAQSKVEKVFIENHIKDFKEHARQVDFMINELIERGERLERFIQSRHFGTESHWAEWKH
ncbi:uncharacterized protein [Chironomus tepperi]|uniref:uncharacterized protein n=1 Tax=Chironomus tepperi TaxID=113505 RepID=UPI00391F8809